MFYMYMCVCGCIFWLETLADLMNQPKKGQPAKGDSSHQQRTCEHEDARRWYTAPFMRIFHSQFKFTARTITM